MRMAARALLTGPQIDTRVCVYNMMYIRIYTVRGGRFSVYFFNLNFSSSTVYNVWLLRLSSTTMYLSYMGTSHTLQPRRKERKNKNKRIYQRRWTQQRWRYTAVQYPRLTCGPPAPLLQSSFRRGGRVHGRADGLVVAGLRRKGRKRRARHFKRISKEIGKLAYDCGR